MAKKVIRLDENVIRKMIINKILENIGGYRDSFKDFDTICSDFVNSYETEGSNSPSTTKFYWELVASFKEEGFRTLRDNDRGDNDAFGKTNASALISDIYLRLFTESDKQMESVKSGIVKTFKEGGSKKVKYYLNWCLTKTLINFRREGSMTSKNGSTQTQKEITAAATRVGTEKDGYEDAISNSSSVFDFGTNEIDRYTGIIENAIDDSNRGNFQFTSENSYYFALAVTSVINGNEADGTSNARNNVELNEKIFNEFNRISKKNVDGNFFRQIKNRFINNDMPKIIDRYMDKDKIAESKLRKAIYEAVVKVLSKKK